MNLFALIFMAVLALIGFVGLLFCGLFLWITRAENKKRNAMETEP